eukprot:7384407-Pyramimonas_sp.AAC.1
MLNSIPGRGRCQHRGGHPAATGRSGGQYRTASLKEYPSDLSRFLAMVVLDAVSPGLPKGLSGYDIPEEALNFYVPLDPFYEFVQQHDCALGGAAR